MTTFEISPNIISNKSKDGDAILICDLEDENDFLLKIKGVSMDFYMLMEKGLNKDQIVSEIINTYNGCSKEQVQKDLDDFISNLIRLKVLNS